MGRIFVLGNACIDTGLALPRLPLVGETLLGHPTARSAGGKGLNQAVVAARAGRSVDVPVHFCAPLGTDAEAQELAAVLTAEPFAGLVLPRLDLATDFSLLMVFPDGDNSIVSAGACAAALGATAATAFAAEAGPGDLLLLQGNLTQATTQAAIDVAISRGAEVMLNPAPLWWTPGPMVPACSVVVLNQGEAAALTGEADPGHAANLLHRAGVALAVVTMGADGCVTADRGGSQHWPAAAATVVDTTGCGDAFCGVLAVQRVRGAALPDAIEAAQRSAAMTAGRPGAYAALPARGDLAHCLHARTAPGTQTKRTLS